MLADEAPDESILTLNLDPGGLRLRSDANRKNLNIDLSLFPFLACFGGFVKHFNVLPNGQSVVINGNIGCHECA